MCIYIYIYTLAAAAVVIFNIFQNTSNMLNTCSNRQTINDSLNYC